MHLKKPASLSSEEQGSMSFAASADDAARWPAFLEFVSATQWPDGSRRVPGSVVLFVEDGRLKLCLSDKDTGAVCFLAARSVLELMDAAETILGNGTGDWRASKTQRPGRK